MYLLFGDEADHDGGPNSKFFLYGAIFIPIDEAANLDREIQKIRKKYGFLDGDRLKFAARDCPEHVDKNNFTAAKDEVIQIATKHAVKFCAYVILNELTASKALEEKMQFGLNSVLGAFNKFLAHQSSYGFAHIDRLPIKNDFSFLRDWYNHGLEFYSGDRRKVDRILSYSLTCDGASAFSSIADIVLGAFRYCVNEEDKDIAGKAMLPKVVNMMWQHTQNNKPTVREYGLLLRPKQEIKKPSFKDEYDNLISRLNGLLGHNYHLETK